MGFTPRHGLSLVSAALLAFLLIVAGVSLPAQALTRAEPPPCAADGARSAASDTGLATTLLQRVPLNKGQLNNAMTITQTGLDIGVPEPGEMIAIATALQESGLRDLDHGDRDSLGLFQQRPSQGWGTRAQVLDPIHAARAFYQGLLAVPDWRTMSTARAAQAVQRSAYPDAYTKWADLARALTDRLPYRACGSTG